MDNEFFEKTSTKRGDTLPTILEKAQTRQEKFLHTALNSENEIAEAINNLGAELCEFEKLLVILLPNLG